jgi:hypothetical protein
MRKRKPRKCRICKKRPVWIGGDVKDPGPFCKRCYHKHRSPGRSRRREELPDLDLPFLTEYEEPPLEDYGVPLDENGMPLAWSSDENYYWACIVAEDEENVDYFGSHNYLHEWYMARGVCFF